VLSLDTGVKASYRVGKDKARDSGLGARNCWFGIASRREEIQPKR